MGSPADAFALSRVHDTPENANRVKSNDSHHSFHYLQLAIFFLLRKTVVQPGDSVEAPRVCVEC